MKTIYKLLLSLSLCGLAACEVSSDSFTPVGADSIGSKPQKIAAQPLQGTIGGVAWKIAKAVGVIQPDGMLQVSMSGNDEVINCNYTLPLKPGVLFEIPMKVANHEFDMLRPNSGHAVTWVYTKNSGFMNVVSDMVNISITSVENDRVVGGLSAKFLDPAHAGTLNGTFEITICR